MEHHYTLLHSKKVRNCEQNYFLIIKPVYHRKKWQKTLTSIISKYQKEYKLYINFDEPIINNNSNKFNEFKPLYVKNLEKEIKNGYCGVTGKVVKDAVEVVINRSLDVINNSLSQGKFPEEWTFSIIVPIPKVPQTIYCTQFRSINTAPVHGKSLEMAVKNQIQNFVSPAL